MHIALFNRSFYPETAATGQLLTELCEGLVRDYGCRITVVAGVPLSHSAAAELNGSNGRRRVSLVSSESYAGIEILRSSGTRFSKRRFVGRATNYVSYFLSACYAGLKLDRPDVIVAATDPPIIGLAAYMAARRFRVPLVMAYQDIFPEVAVLLEDFHSKTVNRALQMVNCFLATRSARNVALGETMRRRLVDGKGADPGRTLVIPSWADCSEIVPSPRKNAFSEAHGLDDKFVVMHSGNIGLSQGLERIIDVAERLSAFPDIRFVFVGDGVKRAALEAKAKERNLTNVMFLPFQPREKLTESFAAADIFLVSLKRGLAGYITPSKLYGILAAGRTYVAAVEDESEVALITRKYQCGLVANPDSVSHIADCILTLYHDRPVLKRYGEKARDAAYEFDRRAQIHAYFTLFRELVHVQGA
jgi:glycosyltransferase involved in cell wall biosynthesis